MTLVRNKLTTYLDERNIKYHLIHHSLDYNAKQTASDTTTPPGSFAKTVVLKVDEGHAIAVVTASERVDLVRFRDAIGASSVELVHEDELLDLFPDCEIGAEPPLGNLYGLPVYVSRALSNDDVITFNAGTHLEVIRMAYADFAKHVQPQVLDIAIGNGTGVSCRPDG
jgi:Ala-tRNA(Pro) deacylase